MSKVQDIIALSQAGFTKNEIVALLGGFENERAPAAGATMSAGEPAFVPEPKLEPAPEPAFVPGPKLEPAPEPAQGQDEGPRYSNSELMEKMDQMLKYVHSMAIRQSEQPPQPSADDVTATILGAPRKE